MATFSSDGEIQLFCSWFGTLSSAEKSWFLDKLVPVATPHKLFVRLERTSLGLGGARDLLLPASWEGCRDFQQRALFCAARVQSWSAARGNLFVNALEEIDQDALYEFYGKISIADKEP